MDRNLFSFKFFTLSAFMIVFMLSLSGCVKKEVSKSSSESSSSANSTGGIITIKKGDKVILDSPEKFVQIWILFYYEQKKWPDELKNNPDTNIVPEVFFDKKKKEFYQSYGLTEESFTKYSENHFKEIETFLEKNPDYKKAYEDSLK